MNDEPEGHPAYTSIADCATCCRIPQKVSEDLEAGGRKTVPPEVDLLRTVLEVEDESTPAYCTSVTRLLKCARCGTYYYYNHYDDDGQHFMDPTCDNITVRRYDPLTAMDFLERMSAGSAGALPNAMGQLTKAFADGTRAPATKIAERSLSTSADVAARELAELKGRVDEIERDLTDVLQNRSPDWQIKTYAVESLFNLCCSREDWDSLSRLLLKSPDPVVRASAANLMMSMGTEDAPVPDLLHATRRTRHFAEKEVAKKARMAELADVLLELALSGDHETLEYDHGFGSSKYRTAGTRRIALYELVVAADHGADLVPSVPSLLRLLCEDAQLNYHVCWVLRTIAEKRTKWAQAILEALSKIVLPKKAAADPNVKQLVEECEKRVREGKKPPRRRPASSRQH